MNLNQLLYFSVTAKHQHFTRAAEELFISQPSLSYAISSLEEDLGVPLFEKKGRNVILTKQGALFLTHVERALNEIKQGREAISRMTAETENRIEIAAFSTSLGPINLPHLLRDFLQDPQNASIHFNFSQCDDNDMISGLKSIKYDIAFPGQQLDAPGIEYIPLVTRSLMAIVPETHALANCASVAPQDLAPYPLLVRENSRSSQLIKRLVPNAKIACSVHEHLSLLSLAAEDFGVAICIPTPESKSFHLREIPIDAPGCSCTIQIAYKKDRYLTPALTRFIAHLKSVCE